MRSIELLDPSRAAALIIDLQRGYCDPMSDAARGPLGWDVTGADAVCRLHVPYVTELRTLLPPERIVWSQMEESPETYAPNNSYGATGDRAHEFVPLCVRGTPGHDFHIVAPSPGEHRVFKVQHSIFSSHTPEAASLDGYLKRLGVSQLIFSGVLLSRCVNASVLVASNYLGYECVLLSDLTGGPKHLEAEMAEHLQTTGFFYANVRTSAEVLAQLRKNHH
jgi:nicotinamidase-related amidase